MVYDSDFYTTRRPYRYTPTYSSYTTSITPSRQVRILPGLGKVHIVHSYDRIVPYVGHKRLTVMTLPPKVYSTRPSVLQREYDWIERKLRPWVSYSATNRYLNSDSAVKMITVRHPISGYKYLSEYNPSRFYNFYRIIRPLSSYDQYWPYRSLSYYDYWPISRTLKYHAFDDLPAYRSLRLQSLYPLTWLNSYSYRPYRWYNYYNHLRYYRPLSLYYNRYWSTNYPSSYWYDYDYSYWPSYRYNYSTYLPSRFLSYYSYWPQYRSRYSWSVYRPISTYSSNYAEYLSYIFDDETRAIRAQTASLLKRIHTPVPRVRVYPIAPSRYEEYSLPVRYSNDTYIHRLLTISPKNKVEYTTYYTEPVKKYIGQGHLSCVSYAGDKGYNRRHHLTAYDYEDPVKNDIQLLSYYISKFRQEKSQPKEITNKAGSVEESNEKVQIVELPE